MPGVCKLLLKVRSGSGRLQLYFLSPGGPVPSLHNFRPGIDVMADGAYVVAPPSRHVSGRSSRFVSNGNLLLPPLPAELRDLICREAQERVHSKASSSHQDQQGFTAGVQPGSGSSNSQPPPSSGRVLNSRRASEIQAEAIHWLWPQRIARGKLSLIAGLPGLGKSQVTTHMAAMVSSGGNWSTGEKCEPGDVFFFSAEDDHSDTIRPRLEAGGANLDRVHIVEAVHVKNAKRDRPFILKQDLDVLAETLIANPDVTLVIIDPISAYLSGVNSHNNAEVRSVLAPLAKLAADHGVAVVCITHLNKGLSTDPLARVIDSTAFGTTVRSAFLIAADTKNPDRRFFLPLKSNISRICPGLAFKIEPHVLALSIETSRVVWEDRPVAITAQEALTAPTQDEIDTAKETAEACVRVFDKQKATELRASDLIKLLGMHENLFIGARELKKRLRVLHVENHERSNANYYFKADFVPP